MGFPSMRRPSCPPSGRAKKIKNSPPEYSSATPDGWQKARLRMEDSRAKKDLPEKSQRYMFCLTSFLIAQFRS
jgi:hypothetical protein